MTDLVKRLRSINGGPTIQEAIKRIEELEARLQKVNGLWPNERGVDVSSEDAARIYEEERGTTYAGACSGALLNERDARLKLEERMEQAYDSAGPSGPAQRAEGAPPHPFHQAMHRVINRAEKAEAEVERLTRERDQRKVVEHLDAAKYAEHAIEQMLEQMFGPSMTDAAGDFKWLWPFRDWHWDDYDSSLEITSANNDLTLTDDQQAILWSEGFERCWLTRLDKTCTYYHKGGTPSVSQNPSVAGECEKCGESRAMRREVAALRESNAALTKERDEALKHLRADDECQRQYWLPRIETVERRLRAAETSNLRMRKLLWLNHGHDGLYGDDGEMQCARCGLDFKRDTVERIEAALAASPPKGPENAVS